MSDNENRKTTTDITFGKVTCSESYAENQNGKRKADTWRTVEDMIYEMFDDADQFVTLTLNDIDYNIRYVQATQVNDGITVQLGIEEGEHTKLVEKICSEDECLDIFEEFYYSSAVSDIEEYKPVEFFA